MVNNFPIPIVLRSSLDLRSITQEEVIVVVRKIDRVNVYNLMCQRKGQGFA